MNVDMDSQKYLLKSFKSKVIWTIHRNIHMVGSVTSTSVTNIRYQFVENNIVQVWKILFFGLSPPHLDRCVDTNKKTEHFAGACSTFWFQKQGLNILYSSKWLSFRNEKEYKLWYIQICWTYRLFIVKNCEEIYVSMYLEIQTHSNTRCPKNTVMHWLI